MRERVGTDCWSLQWLIQSPYVNATSVAIKLLFLVPQNLQDKAYFHQEYLSRVLARLGMVAVVVSLGTV